MDPLKGHPFPSNPALHPRLKEMQLKGGRCVAATRRTADSFVVSHRMSEEFQKPQPYHGRRTY